MTNICIIRPYAKLTKHFMIGERGNPDGDYGRRCTKFPYHFLSDVIKTEAPFIMSLSTQ